MIVDLFLVYQFVRRLATPFKEWEAYKLGIIDENGKVLKKRKDLRLVKERDAFGVFDVMVLNIKKLLAKIPGGSSRFASYAAALYLIREWNSFTKENLLNEDISDERVSQSARLFYDRYINYTHLSEAVKEKMQETPTVNVGSGAIAGLGVGPQGEPGLTPSQMKRYKSRNKGPKKLRDIIGEKL